MKRLWIILAVFAVMMGIATYEAVATRKFYGEMLQNLDALEASFAAHEDSLDDPENLAVLERVEKKWLGSKRLTLTFGNHTAIRNVDERIVSLGSYTRQNEYADAINCLKLAKQFITELKDDALPGLTNLV